MSTPEPYVPISSIRNTTLRRDIDRLARELLDVKQEINGYLDPLKSILDPLEEKKQALQAQLNETAAKLAKLSPLNRRVLAAQWKMYYRKGRTVIDESRLLERGVDISDINASKVERGGTYIVEPIVEPNEAEESEQ